ncbi:beta-lactamase domain protein [Oleidesulfovibrio alaskensis G20]|jgi:glyoxylase-like metal-dependent hydrolase (beta-lactamase superfamily II)|uniref:Beta-lactamase domain protein n=1 Tax=Oleidesulfovibrio alaskensis (strain ATCC BAA-1058 / DSM 17464 / G20) TaxID=207559 RepID=Q314Q9_OLEA2|nr:MBL fold metallo-hydrolase [Oleidesulfovibrio alaskensis]ABB37587.1 beta-lactamase domain protein [Oleidesulfovibrio alaskensis G20]MBG0774755.1 MBL fold metallo-hydrolase [Oleidesulfovibrio alaskensis]MBL3581346.1 MBL fold metallo-hydrolase [Oleidesulfovibrio alaskensis]
MTIRTFPIGPLETNCHILSHQGQALAVDPGGDPAQLLEYCTEKSLQLKHILLTHLHFDHLYGVAALAERTGAQVSANNADAYLMQTELGKGGMFGFPRVQPFDFTALEAGEHTFIGLSCTVLETPGHTPGSFSFYFPQAEAVFVGDLLFHRSVGRTDFPGGDSATLLNSVKKAIFSLPDTTVVYPGHGIETTVGDEKLNNPFFTEFRR